MSDGEDDATLDGPYRRPTSGAAPWERFSQPPCNDSVHRWQADLPVERDDQPVESHALDTDGAEKTGSHSNGVVTVADLIAKIGAPTSDRPSRHRITETPAYSLEFTAELGDLEVANYPGTDEPEPDLTAPRRVLSRIRRRKADKAPPTTPEAPETPGEKSKRRRRPMLMAGRSLAALFAVLALAATGSAWQWSASKNARLNTVSALDPHSSDIRDPNGQYGDEDFLIVGLDSRAGENAKMGAGDTEDADGARSDTIMLVNIPANRKRVVVVSFPRDLAITPIQCEAWNADTGKYGPIYDRKRGTWGSKMVYTETKLNSTYAFGGPKCLVKEIQKLSGLSINRFIAVDFAGFAKMVDTLGGVDVCTSAPLHDYELGTVLEHAGHQIVDGPTALNYVRARQVTTESNGDYGRIKRQQRFVSSLLRSLISEDTLLDLDKLNNVVNVFINDSTVDNVKTKDLVQLGQSLQGMAAGHITFVTVPTGITDQNGDEPPRTADMRALFDAIINDDPLPLENDHNAQKLGNSPTSGSTTAPTTKNAPPPTASPESRREQVTTTSPQDVTVRVSNATAQSGLASIATKQLRWEGFNVMAPDDYPSPVKTTTVFFSPGNEQAAATVASAFANSKVERVSGYGQVVQVVLGPDFNSVNTPPASGSSVSVQIDRNSGSTPTKLPEDLTVTNAADTTCQ